MSTINSAEWDKSPYVERCNTHLNELLQPAHNLPTGQEKLYAAMRYSVLSNGKRVRPLLVYAAGKLQNADLQALDSAAAAVEFVHCYSLIHDDLPAMDDDDLRRGQPTLHKYYDEATAILAGDALLSLAFDAITRAVAFYPSMSAVIQSLQLLGRASGGLGMVGGQMLDIEMAGKTPTVDQLETMFSLKTGALIHASVMLGAFCANMGDDNPLLRKLDIFGRSIGLCFQVQDDILDVIGDTETIGKPQGSDAEKDKPNYALRYGLGQARARADKLFEEAMDQLADYGADADPLRYMAAYITRRNY